MTTLSGSSINQYKFNAYQVKRWLTKKLFHLLGMRF